MNVEEQGQPEIQNSASAAPELNEAATQSDAGASRATVRRRLVLGGLGAAAGLATMRPIKTLAKYKKKSKKYCSYSGWHSFKINTNTSASPGPKNCKGGYKYKYWYSKYKWKLPKSSKKTRGYTAIYIRNYQGTSVRLYQNTTFKSLFGSGSTSTIMQCLSSGLSNECGYLTAVLNAYNYHGSGYPYTYQQIYSYWTTPSKLGTGVDQTHAALFFQQLNAFG